MALSLKKEAIMQKKILRTTALILCFCILLLAVPNTFARSEKRSRFESSKSRFLFVNPGELLTNVLFFLAPHFDHHADRTGTPPDNKNTKNFKKKLTGDLNKVKISDD